MSTGVSCTKCGAPTWEEMIDEALYFKCPSCGKLTPQFTPVGLMTIIHTEAQRADNLPRKGTKLSLCLGTLADLETATTGQIAVGMDQNSDDTASQLSVLQGRGLSKRITEKKGVEGGSTWMLTPYAEKLLGISGR